MIRQRILATIGGGLLGLFLGMFLGAITCLYLTPVANWERSELYGLPAFANRIGAMGRGAFIGGSLGGLAGTLFGYAPTWKSAAQDPPRPPTDVP
jgi:hypothetical protein